MRHRIFALLTATALTVTGCTATTETNTATDAAAPASGVADTSAGVIDNCGYEIASDIPVTRAVALEQGASDTLLMLGAGDQIAGVGHQKDNPPDGYEVPTIISPKIPTAEQIRAADADFIYSPFESLWTADSAGTRDEWQKLGVRTYLSNTECTSYGDNKGKTSFELIEKDLGELGVIFGREAEAKELQEKLRATLADANQAPDGTTFVLIYSALGGAPYVAGGPSIVTEMGSAVNMTNAFGDLKEEWPQVSWEAVAEANPDVIILADLPNRGEPGDTWQEKVADLEATPGTRELEAVKQGRYIVINGVTTSPSARSYLGLKQISDAIGDGIAG